MHEVTELEKLRLERDLYWRLLELGTHEDLTKVLEEALSLIVEVTLAKKAYLAIYQREDDSAPRWSITSGCSDEELQSIRQKISSGIIAEAMATGETISTSSALEDPRFKKNESVRAQKIKAVLCAPLGRSSSLGVLYLQERKIPGPFLEGDRLRAEAFVRHLAPFVERLRKKVLENEEQDLTLPYRKRLRLEGILGASKILAGVFSQVESAARFELPVLLTGASGTGKTALAHSIHQNSPRASRPFVELNCAAIPENLFESEFFGAAQGAHSTATKKVLGKVAAAEGGTLFLDEIGELPLGVQAKLLQFLQSKEYFPLGSSKPERSDVRLLAATNASLESAINQKTFREDLYYRLNVLTIRVPSLAERRGDVPLLAAYFCQQTCAQHGLAPLALTPSALEAVHASDWPGNIRQLAHAIQSATVRASMEGALALEPHHIFPEAHKEPEGPSALTFHELVRQAQQRAIAEALEATSWNISEAARRLDIARSYLNTMIQSFRLQRGKRR